MGKSVAVNTRDIMCAYASPEKNPTITQCDMMKRIVQGTNS